jgi:drug/metabolite transporter (DMT)-like permease
MQFPLHLLLPLASSFGYVAAVLLLKRSAAFGVGLWRTTFVANLTTAVFFAPFWALGPAENPTGEWWQPVLTSLLFSVGQIFTFRAIQGDVSVATPVLGLKIILVAVFSTWLLADGVPLQWWLAALLSTAAIAMLHRGRPASTRQVGRTVLMAAFAAASFALSDVFVQKWTPLWGVGRFQPILFGLVMLWSLAFIPLFRFPLRTIPIAGWRWLLPGSLLLALQAAGMSVAVGVYGDATAVNVVYSSRGLWSVLAVWLVGHWFRNDEQQLGATVLRGRLLGAGLMLAAIGVVLLP